MAQRECGGSMNLREQIYYSCAAYSSIHPNRAAVLNHLFCVIGNGYEWHKGKLIALDGDMFTKNGRPLSLKAAINKTFRNRRNRNEFRKQHERKQKREAKLALQHKKDCPTSENDALRCDCGASARIAEHNKFMASIDATIEKVLAEMAKRSPEEKEAAVKESAAALKHTKRMIADSARYEYRIPADIDARVKDTNYDHWYPMCSYSKMVCFPDNVKPEWLNAIIETAQLVIANPPKVAKHSPQGCVDKTVAL